MLKIKDNLDLNILVSKYEFILVSGCYIRCGRTRDVFINKDDRTIIDYKKDRFTYTGYAYSNEYKHNTKHYIKDLIVDGLVEKC